MIYDLTIRERLWMLAHVWQRELRRRWHRNRWRRRRIVRRLARNRARGRVTSIAAGPDQVVLPAGLGEYADVTIVTGSNRFGLSAQRYTPPEKFLGGTLRFFDGVAEFVSAASFSAQVAQSQRAAQVAERQHQLGLDKRRLSQQWLDTRADHVIALAMCAAREAGVPFKGAVEEQVAAYIAAHGDISDSMVRAIVAEVCVEREDRVRANG